MQEAVPDCGGACVVVGEGVLIIVGHELALEFMDRAVHGILHPPLFIAHHGRFKPVRVYPNAGLLNAVALSSSLFLPM